VVGRGDKTPCRKRKGLSINVTQDLRFMGGGGGAVWNDLSKGKSKGNHSLLCVMRSVTAKEQEASRPSQLGAFALVLCDPLLKFRFISAYTNPLKVS
jgi:hypothetical protein